ncbi:MAG: DedA family protein [Desulfobacca sp.]|nr:DedA family protein [Desulfobacca sp.]
MISLATIEYLVGSYGYWAILLGTFIEGETILIVGGFVAHLGFLKLPYVMITAFIGSFFGDQFFFILGRFKGPVLLARFGKAQKQVDKIHIFLEKHKNLIMTGFRFIYGIRILTPIVLGMNHKISAKRFFIFNAIGAIVWSVVVSLGGYLFGEALHLIMKDIKQYELKIIIGLVVIGLLAWLLNRLTGKMSKVT